MILHQEAGYIYADYPFILLQTSCSSAADHTFERNRDFATVVESDVSDERISILCNFEQTGVVGMIFLSRLRRRAVQQTSQLERVLGRFVFWKKADNRVLPTSTDHCPMPHISRNVQF
jgi:hypothetical protein